jgi:hypothetical protein
MSKRLEDASEDNQEANDDKENSNYIQRVRELGTALLVWVKAAAELSSILS